MNTKKRRPLTKRQKKQLAKLGAMALGLVLVLILGILLIRTGVRNSKYNRLYTLASESYAAQEYDQALSTAKQILSIKKLKVDKQVDVYLLMADIYLAQDKPQAAKNLLEDAYSVLGSEKLQQRLLEVQALLAAPEETSGDVVIGTVTVAADADNAVLVNMGLTSADIAPLGQITTLQSLNLNQNQLTDLSALEGLTGLTYLSLSDNQLKDISALSKLTGLKTLYLDNNPITDFTPLYGLSNLTLLSLRGVEMTQEELDALCDRLPNCAIYRDYADVEETEITIGGQTVALDVTELELIDCGLTDISEIGKLTELEYLNLQGNDISDLTPLAGLTKLKKLVLWDNDISNIYPLVGLTNLTYLDIDSNSVSDLSPLASLTNLTQLWCSGNRPSSLQPLASLKRLTNLGLKNDGLSDSDLDVLKKLTSLVDLRLDGNSNLTAKAIDSLQSALPGCTISKPSGLTGSITLGGTTYYSDATSISCNNAGVSDISGLASFTNLTSLSLSGNNITSLSALSGLTNLTSLDLSYNTGITSVSALASLKNLTSLSLAGCTGITAAYDLYGLSNLRTLDVTGTGLTWEQVDMLRASLVSCAVFSDTQEPVEDAEGDIDAYSMTGADEELSFVG
jgi:internalin A